MTDNIGSVRRDVLGSLFAGRWTLFDRLNANAEFVRIRQSFRGKPIFPERTGLHRHIASLTQDAPVDYLEFGVWKGETLKLWTTLNGHEQSRFFGFDTFEGLPEDWGDVPRGTFAVDGCAPRIDDTRVRFVRGLFQDTLYGFLEDYARAPRLVVHIDCDLYSSTLFTLAALDRILRDGDILIFDDFYSLEHEFQAFMDYRRSFYRNLEPLATVHHCTQVALQLQPAVRGTSCR